MVFYEKSQPSPACLIAEKAKNGDYKTPETLRRLEEDFKGKCYICESKNCHTINVEHFTPHRGNVDLEFDWNNLFWACGHCNNIKLAKYDNILNCTSEADNVETSLRYYMKPFPKERVTIEVITNTPKAQHTKNLLEDVYNGTTNLKKIESSHIRSNLLREIMEFQKLLFDFYDTFAGVKEERNRCKMRIRAHLDRSSNFTAFKRWIIRDSPEIMADFGDFISL